MLNFALFLHFYQPPTQFPEITKKIASESYEKILKILQTQKNARLTLNFPASLIEQLERVGLTEVTEGFKKLAEEGRIEFTGSAAYHPLLPRIPKEEMERQIRLNEKINKKYFGRASVGKGFFPPEMAYSPEVGEVVEKLGYKWIILDESAIEMKNENRKTKKEIYQKKNSNLAVFIRNKKLSLAIAFAQIKSVIELFRFFDTEEYSFKEDRPARNAPATTSKMLAGAGGYIIIALDGETFGHHQPGQLQFLEELLRTHNSEHRTIKFVTISELLKLFPIDKEIEAKESTWGESWERWDNPKNPIHRLQWKLYDLALNIAGDGSCRQLLDRALHSDQFWWASHSPCWHPKMVERGARMLRDVVLLSPSASWRKKKEAQKLYNEIILIGRKLYGDEVIPC